MSHVISLEDWDNHFDQVSIIIVLIVINYFLLGIIGKQQACLCEATVDFCVSSETDLCSLSTICYCS